MEPLTLILLASTVLFAGVSVLLSQSEHKAKKQLKATSEEEKQRLYQLRILKEIQDRIGYTLDIENIVDVIAGSLRNLFPYSTVSSLLLKDDRLILKTSIEQEVDKKFLEQVKGNMLSSMGALYEKPLPTQIQESTQGVLLSDKAVMVRSFFQIPLIVHDRVLGIINISSLEPGLYKESQMTILYQIVNQAANALGKLEDVLEREKSKLLAMVKSLEDGVFMVDSQNQLQIINDMAKKLLHIQDANPTTLSIFAAFEPLKAAGIAPFDLASEMQTVLSSKQPAKEKEVKLQGKTIQVFINPVLSSNGATLIGASVLLHDITLEKNLEQMREDFTNIMVHELRAPLTAIKGSAKLIASSDISPEQQKKITQSY